MIAQSPPALSLPLRTARITARVPVCPPDDVQPRFTVDGSRDLEQRLARTCDRIAAGVRGLVPARKLEAILLGGGYGRGEGGVWRSPTGDRPYNDLEFYVCIRGNRHLNELRFGRALHVLGEILTPQAGVEVEFKITSLRELATSQVSMFSYDLVAGHRWLVGDDTLLDACAHHRDPQQIPVCEATRLLMNRCSGLLFAKERLEKTEFTAADSDFVRRNIAKARLALGDALLVGYGQYHWSALERHRRVERLSRIEPMPWLRDVTELHADGVEFKLHPERSTAPRDELLAQHASLVTLARDIWLWVESWRLQNRFGSAREYALSPLVKCPEANRARNVLVSLRALGLKPARELRAHRHPRERIFHALALLLWEPGALTDPECLARLQSELQAQATTFPQIMGAYRALWPRVN